MAYNLLRAGFDLTVYNRTAAKAQPLVDLGASQAVSPREVAQNADVVITSLMDDQSVLDVVTGAEGLLAGLREGGIHIGASTSSPRLGAHLAELHRAQGMATWVKLFRYQADKHDYDEHRGKNSKYDLVSAHRALLLGESLLLWLLLHFLRHILFNPDGL